MLKSTPYRIIYNYIRFRKIRINNILNNKIIVFHHTCYKVLQKECPRCYKKHIKRGTFCSRNCANSRIQKEISKKKIRESLYKSIKYHNIIYKQYIYKILNNKNVITLKDREDEKNKFRSLIFYRKCNSCKKLIVVKTVGWGISNKRYCDICRTKNAADNIIKKMLIKGSTFWKLNSEKRSFSYKGLTLKCDSILEKAAIIYLLDIFKVDTIKRFEGYFKYVGYNNKTRYMNPDFIATKDNINYVIEVKMLWNKKANYDYNTSIPYKKIALGEYCKKEGYKDIWLDYNYDKSLGKIYRKLQKENIKIHN